MLPALLLQYPASSIIGTALAASTSCTAVPSATAAIRRADQCRSSRDDRQQRRPRQCEGEAGMPNRTVAHNSSGIGA